MPDMASVLPAWASEKNQLYISDGKHEVVARSLDGGVTWQKKTGRCDKCGECCIVYTDGVPGTCPYLVERDPGNYYCEFTENSAFEFGTPNDCVRGNGEGIRAGCTIAFEEVP